MEEIFSPERSEIPMNPDPRYIEEQDRMYIKKVDNFIFDIEFNLAEKENSEKLLLSVIGYSNCMRKLAWSYQWLQVSALWGNTSIKFIKVYERAKYSSDLLIEEIISDADPKVEILIHLQALIKSGIKVLTPWEIWLS